VRARAVAAALACALVALASACAMTSRGAAARSAPAPLRVSALAQDGDARRRASTQLVLDGLAVETRGSERDAVARYEDALKVDANNPLASLALARFEIFEGNPDRGLAHLDRYAALTGGRSDAAAHLAGLRGAALAKLGKRALAAPYLEEARALAPEVWADGRLDPAELR
jgi:Tfp pilus assembly protein PilF